MIFHLSLGCIMSEKAIPYIHQQLVEKAKQNSRSAQSQLYELYFKAIYNSCYRIIGDQFTAEDIMHDAFIEAFKNIHQHRGQVTFGAWLKKIAINRSINYLKKEKLIAHKLEDYRIENQEQEENSENFSIKDIKLTLKELPPNYRLIFSLYLIEGYDHDEIASILKISASTSRSQLSRAKKQVRTLLEQQKYSTI